jgi:ATP-dependent Clp protease ATP-binding subunit ClpA
MFERFTDRSRRVVVLAQEEARLSKSNTIHEGHLLAGLIHEGGSHTSGAGIACQVLTELGVTLEHLRAQNGEGTTENYGHLPFTPEVKRILEMSLREALQLGHNYIGTEHILLGVCRQEGVIEKYTDVLSSASVRKAVIEKLSKTGSPDVKPPPITTLKDKLDQLKSPLILIEAGHDTWDIYGPGYNFGKTVRSSDDTLDRRYEKIARVEGFDAATKVLETLEKGRS